MGSGEQYWSWIGLDDVVGAIQFALENGSLRGPVNLVSPQPARNQEFVRALGEVLHRPTIFPLPAWVARIALGEMADAAILGSARVEPAKLQAAGYRFVHRDLRQAIRAALHDA